jgi:monoamine oxidase
MISRPSNPDIVIVGAGAAGIAAGRELARLRIPFLIIEGRDRIGGRALTRTIGRGHRVDLGCEWLHSADRNVLASLARETGVGLDMSPPPWRKRHLQAGFDHRDQDAFEIASQAFYARLETAAAEARRTGRDGRASASLESGGRWNGLLDAISTYYNGAPLDRVSILDFDAYLDTEVNWRAIVGYGALIAALGADLPLQLGCSVRRLDGTGRDIRLETDLGTIVTRQVIVTVPTNVVASGAIRFDPALDGHVAAAAGLPLGLADKVYFELEAPQAFAPDTRLLGATDRTDMGSYTLRSRGAALVEGYFGGDYARQLEAGGLAAFADAAQREIGAVLGRDIAAKLKPLVATAWASDPFALGSYSHALPGQADARARLAAPIDGRILFAGEATSPHFFSTAHGAWEEGVRAARALTAGDRVASAAARP